MSDASLDDPISAAPEAEAEVDAEIVAPWWEIVCGDGPDGLLGSPDVDFVWVDFPFEDRVEERNAAETTRDNAFDFEAMTPELLTRAAAAIAARCKRWTVVKTSWEETYLVRAAFEAAGMEYVRQGEWIKTNAKPQQSGDRPAQGSEALCIFHSKTCPMRWNGGGRPATWYARVVQGDAKIHPTQTPDELFKQIFEDFTNPGDTIVDIMAGSFRSGVVAVSLGRNYRGWELQQKYVTLAHELFKLPLFDKKPLQADLFGTRTSTRMQNLRAELDRSIMRIVTAAVLGIPKADIVGQLQIEGATPEEITRSLQRLRKKELIRREGRTNDSLYFRVSVNSDQSLPSTGDAHP